MMVYWRDFVGSTGYLLCHRYLVPHRFIDRRGSRTWSQSWDKSLGLRIWSLRLQFGSVSHGPLLEAIHYSSLYSNWHRTTFRGFASCSQVRVVHINRTSPCSSRCHRIHIDMSSRLGDEANQHPRDRCPPPCPHLQDRQHRLRKRRSCSPTMGQTPSHDGPSPGSSLRRSCRPTPVTFFTIHRMQWLHKPLCFDRHARVDHRAQMESTTKFDGVVAYYFEHVMESLPILGATTAIADPAPSSMGGLASCPHSCELTSIPYTRHAVCQLSTHQHIDFIQQRATLNVRRIGTSKIILKCMERRNLA